MQQLSSLAANCPKIGRLYESVQKCPMSGWVSSRQLAKSWTVARECPLECPGAISTVSVTQKAAKLWQPRATYGRQETGEERKEG